MKKVAVVTGSRSEYGILRSVIKAISQHPSLDLQLWVTGMHLLNRHGNTIAEIEHDRWPIDAVVPMYEEENASYPKALTRAIEGFESAIQMNQPDWIVVLGDRLEAFAVVQVASILRVPIAHIHGGDRTDGANIDEQIRHAITRFAHLHFAASKESADRLIKMGEESWRIQWVGAPALDTILTSNLYTREQLSSFLSFDLSNPFILCVQHSVTSQSDHAYEQMRTTLRAVESLKLPVVVIYPNNDEGSDGIIRAIQPYNSNPLFSVQSSVPQEEYLSLLSHANVLVGNSSSGLFEAPSFGLPMVHVGIRNKGREHADNIAFVEHDVDAIVEALHRALFDESYRTYIRQLENPFGDGKAGERIANRLAGTFVDDSFFRKQLSF